MYVCAFGGEIGHNNLYARSAQSNRILSVPQAMNDLAHYHEQITTGFLEDIFTNTMLLIDRCINYARSTVNNTFEKGM